MKLAGSPPKQIQNLTGYLVFGGLTSAFYLGVWDPLVTNNRELVQRRLEMLKEQRQLQNELLKSDGEPHKFFTSKDRGNFFRLFDRYAQPYK